MTHPPDAPTTPVAVSAWMITDTYAIHPSLFGATGWARWTVTHLPTSVALGWFTTLSRAKAYAWAVDQALPHLQTLTNAAAFTSADLGVVNSLYADHAAGELDARQAIRALAGRASDGTATADPDTAA